MPREATIHGVGIVGEGGMGAPAVILEARNEIIPIFVDGSQAETIERARQGVPVERPMTHDLFADVLDDVDVTLEKVRIDDLVNETFHAKLDLAVERETGYETIVRDARPSDGLALAVRVDCPVLIADDVIDAAGQPPETLETEPPDRGPSGPAGGGRRPDVGREDPESSERTESEDIDLDDAVEIDIGETEDGDQDDDSES